MRLTLGFALALSFLFACSAREQRQTQQTAASALTAAAVQTKLATIDADAATQVRVAVSDGTVTLSGTAHDARERAAYVDAAASVGGVHHVVDKLRIAPRARGPRETIADAALAAKVSANIAAQAGINVANVHPAVQDGVVTLSGSVSSATIKSTIIEVTRKTSGVRRVVDRIEVKR